MERNLESVMQDALALDATSKLILAERLLSDDAKPGHRELWATEIHRRIEEVRTGQVETIDALEMIRETREQLGCNGDSSS